MAENHLWDSWGGRESHSWKRAMWMSRAAPLNVAPGATRARPGFRRRIVGGLLPQWIWAALFLLAATVDCFPDPTIDDTSEQPSAAGGPAELFPGNRWISLLAPVWSTRTALMLVTAAGFGAVVFVTVHLVSQEYARRRLFTTIMKEAQEGNAFRIKSFHKLDNPSSEPSVAVQSHVVLRNQLFVKLFQGSDGFAPTIHEADGVIERSGEFSQSWQRKLPTEAKQELKARVIRSAVAILPYYETLRRDFEAKHLLYTQRLVSDGLFKELRDEFVSVCNHIRLLMFDGDCLEEGWGTNGLISLAGQIVATNREKQMQVELQRRQALLRSMYLGYQQQQQKQKREQQSPLSAKQRQSPSPQQQKRHQSGKQHQQSGQSEQTKPQTTGTKQESSTSAVAAPPSKSDGLAKSSPSTPSSPNVEEVTTTQ